MDCCGMFSSRTDATGVGDNDLEGATLIDEKMTKKGDKYGTVVVFDDTIGPLNDATAEGLRLSEIRRKRILQSKPPDVVVSTVTPNMFISKDTNV